MGLIRATRFVFEKLEQSHEDILDNCRGFDLIVSSVSTAAGMNEAELLGLPYLSINFMPWIIPIHNPKLPLSQKITYASMSFLIGLLMRRPFNRIRRRHGLAPVGAEGFTSAQLDLIPISPHVFTPSRHWQAQHHICGYLFSESPEAWQAPDDLLTFLENGDPPLVISLGSIGLIGNGAMEIVKLFIDAIYQVGIRAVIQGWTAELQQLDLPSTIYAAGSMPHRWLLSRAHAVVHHGGFGTTAAGFRAGIPTLIIPHIADQFFWGQHVQRLGVGVSPIARPKLTSINLAVALEELAHNSTIQATASQLGEKIRNEVGVDNAVALIEKTFQSK